MKIFITVLALAITFVPTEAGPGGRILYGDFANQRDFTYHVGFSLGREWNSPISCSGAIISNTWVLTAAHCLYGKRQLTLRFGSTNLFAPELNHTITSDKFKIHPEFNYFTINNDIGLIETPEIVFNDKINKVALPIIQATQPDWVNQYLKVAGWGLNEQNQYESRYLKYLQLIVISNKVCQKSVPFTTITEKMLCTATIYYKSTCFGDSGGPLVTAYPNERLVGIVSFGSPFGCNLLLPIVFVRVTEFLPWIRSISGVEYY